MTPEAFALLVAGCGLSLPPLITTDRLRAYAQAESGLNPQAVSPPNRDGSRDFGLLQINQQHFRRFGVDARTVMDPCTNIRIGVTILAEADRAASCLYNTGRARCANGYPERIQAAASSSRGYDITSTSPAPALTARKPDHDQVSAPAPHSWDVWATPAPEPAPPPPAVEVEAEKSRVIVELKSGD